MSVSGPAFEAYCREFDRLQDLFPHWGHYEGKRMATDLEKMSETLREAFPYGHPEFLPMLLEKMKLHSDKNHDYSKGGRPLGNFERVATLLGQYPGLRLNDPVVVMLIYALKQVDATLWGFAQGITQKVEGPIDRLGDVLVYAGIAICALKDRAASDELNRAKLLAEQGGKPITATEIRERMAQAVIDKVKMAERRDAPSELDAPATQLSHCAWCEQQIAQGKLTEADKQAIHPPTAEEKADIFRPEIKHVPPPHHYPRHPWLQRS